MSAIKQRFPCRADLDFYQSRSVPRWAQNLLPKEDCQSAPIDRCVNAHAGIRKARGELAAHNLLTILQSMRRRGANLESELARIAVTPGCLIDPKRRAAFAWKWAARLVSERFPGKKQRAA